MPQIRIPDDDRHGPGSSTDPSVDAAGMPALAAVARTVRDTLGALASNEGNGAPGSGDGADAGPAATEQLREGIAQLGAAAADAVDDRTGGALGAATAATHLAVSRLDAGDLDGARVAATEAAVGYGTVAGALVGDAAPGSPLGAATDHEVATWLSVQRVGREGSDSPVGAAIGRAEHAEGIEGGHHHPVDALDELTEGRPETHRGDLAPAAAGAAEPPTGSSLELLVAAADVLTGGLVGRLIGALDEATTQDGAHAEALTVARDALEQLDAIGMARSLAFADRAAGGQLGALAGLLVDARTAAIEGDPATAGALLGRAVALADQPADPTPPAADLAFGQGEGGVGPDHVELDLVAAPPTDHLETLPDSPVVDAIASTGPELDAGELDGPTDAGEFDGPTDLGDIDGPTGIGGHDSRDDFAGDIDPIPVADDPFDA